MMSRINKIIVALGVLALGYLGVSPYLMLINLKEAVDVRDGEAVAEQIDFQSVRENLKDQLNFMIAQKTVKSNEQSVFAAAGAALATTLVDGMVDKFVTPSGLIGIMAQGDSNMGLIKDSVRAGQAAIENSTLSYEGWDKFSVTFMGSTGEVELILRRRGLGWKITEIRLPLDI